MIDDYPVYGSNGTVDALLAVPQPPVRLLRCHGHRYRIRYPACEGWAAGVIQAIDPDTRRPAVRQLKHRAAASRCK